MRRGQCGMTGGGEERAVWDDGGKVRRGECGMMGGR